MLFGWFASFNLGHLQQSLGWTRGALPLKRWWGIKLLFLFFANDAAIAVLMVRGINDWKDWNVLCSCSDLVRPTHSKDVTVQSGTYSQKQGFLKSWLVPKMWLSSTTFAGKADDDGDLLFALVSKQDSRLAGDGHDQSWNICIIMMMRMIAAPQND